MWIYVGTGSVILLLLFIVIYMFCFIRKRQKNVRHARSYDSAESGTSEDSFY